MTTLNKMALEKAVETAAREMFPRHFWDNPPNQHHVGRNNRARDKIRAALLAAQPYMQAEGMGWRPIEEYKKAEDEAFPPATDAGLMPCPFCGSAAEVSGSPAMYYARCANGDCIASDHGSHYMEMADAIAAWNRRPAPQPEAPCGGLPGAFHFDIETAIKVCRENGYEALGDRMATALERLSRPQSGEQDESVVMGLRGRLIDIRDVLKVGHYDEIVPAIDTLRTQLTAAEAALAKAEEVVKAFRHCAPTDWEWLGERLMAAHNDKPGDQRPLFWLAVFKAASAALPAAERKD